MGALGEAGPDATARSRLFESFGVPRDPRGIVLLWQNVAGVGTLIFFVVIAASLLSIRRVLVLEPAAVFRG